MKRKSLVLILAAVVLVLASVGGTLAYLTATTSSLTNTFTVGNIGLTVDETSWTDGSKIVPGATIPKNPTVHPSGTEESWVYLKVEIPAQIKTVMEQPVLGAGWSYDSTLDLYYYANKVSASSTVPALFENIVIKTTADNTAIAAIGSAADKTIDITAYAIQASAGSNALAAWDTVY